MSLNRELGMYREMVGNNKNTFNNDGNNNKISFSSEERLNTYGNDNDNDSDNNNLDKLNNRS